MISNQISRKNCILCGSNNLTNLKTLKNFPVFMGLGDGSASDDIKNDLVFDLCEECEGVQISKLMPLDIIYAKSHGSGVVGKVWKEHHSAFAEFVLELTNNDKSILEIGGGHGFLSSFCFEKGIKNWTVIEPNPGDYYLDHVVVRKGFFGNKALGHDKFHTLVHSHLFEHVYDPHDFISNVKKNLTREGRVIFSIPNMDAMLNMGYRNMLNFEHTYYLSERVVNYLMNINGFKLIETRKYLDDHSIFYCFELDCHNDMSIKKVNNKALRDRFNKYFDSFISEANALNEKLKTLEYDKAFCFGGHIFSQYLMAYGVNETFFAGLLDNDPHKHGGRLYGSNLTITYPDIVGKYFKPLVVTSHTGAYRMEIEIQLKNINPNVVLV